MYPGGPLDLNFTTRNLVTGALADADPLPTAIVLRNGVVVTSEITDLTVTNITTGTYKVTGQMPTVKVVEEEDTRWTYDNGDRLQVMVTATVNSIPDTATICDEVLINPWSVQYGVNADRIMFIDANNGSADNEGLTPTAAKAGWNPGGEGTDLPAGARYWVNRMEPETDPAVVLIVGDMDWDGQCLQRPYTTLQGWGESRPVINSILGAINIDWMADHTTVQNLTFANAADNGNCIAVGTHATLYNEHTTIRDCTFISVSSLDISLDRCKHAVVENCIFASTYSGSYPSGISITGGSEHCVVRHNRFDNRYYAVQFGSATADSAINCISHDNVITNHRSGYSMIRLLAGAVRCHSINDVNEAGGAVTLETVATNTVTHTASTHDAAAVVAAMLESADSFKATGFSTHDAAAVVTALLAKDGITAGGTATVEDILKAIYAASRGKMALTTDGDNIVVAVKDDDDDTTLYTLTMSTTGRTVA